jgi:lantibiotic leader peptide-processing serine protease
MRSIVRFTVGVLIVAVGAMVLPLGSATPARASDSKQYILLGLGGQLPDSIDDLVASVGAKVVDRDDEIGIAVVESSDPAFPYAATSLPGVQGLTENKLVSFAPPVDAPLILDSSEQDAVVPSADDPAQALLLWAQWNLRDIEAEQAWAAGFRGAPNVKVAVIDSGIDDTQQELVGKVDRILSRSFIEESLQPLPPDVNPATVKNWEVDTIGHGTHVAGIIAARGVSVAGVAPRVTLIAVKVVGKSGFADWGTIIKAIIYAANSGANVINMSFSEAFNENSPGFDQLQEALQRTVNYAFRKGAVLVASAGNNGINWDLMDDMVRLPAMLNHVVGVSATGPVFGVNPDALAAYSDYGREIVTLAAPGGTCVDFNPMTKGRCVGDKENRIPPDPVLSACSTFLYRRIGQLPERHPLNWPCRFAVLNRRIVRVQSSITMWGTSMSAAHVSGVAALVASATGGSKDAAQIVEILKRSADHVGYPWRNAQYGFGRVNAFRAVMSASQQAATRLSEIGDDQP